MRAILIAAVAGVLAAGAATAHNNLGQAPQEQAAGVLTCTTKPELSLVFGKTPVAACTFAAYRGGFRQSYVALFQAEAAEPFTDRARTVTWRVMNQDGFARPGMLDGVFASRDAQAGTNLAGTNLAGLGLTGQRASLVPLTQSTTTGARLNARYLGMALAATSKGFTH